MLTIHNIGYQGVLASEAVADLGLAAHRHLLDSEDLAAGRFNVMKTGLLHADVITTVSRTYAQEIQTREHGFGLEWLLRARAGRVIGIVNGVDYGSWDPSTDPHLPYPYSPEDLSGKRKMKLALLEESGIGGENDLDVPILGIVSRLTAQKGFELAFEALPAVLARRDFRVDCPGQRRGASTKISSSGCSGASPAAPGSTAATTSRWPTGSRPEPTSS